MISEAVHRLLEAEIGLDHDSVGASSVRAAVASRMKARGVTEPAAYLELLARREELAALIDEVVIPETWFFRDRIPFQLVRELAEGAASSAAPLRILSAPCSSGEEPYSIAMALLDAGLPPERFRVDGIDVSTRLLERARAGIYGPFSFRGGEVGFRDRHFRRVEGEDERWQLAAEVRSAVNLLHDNLLAPRRLHEAEYDLIFCRNLLIYLTPEARHRVLDSLVRALAPDGRIVVGHAEALDALDSRFVTSGVRGSFTFARRPIVPVEVPGEAPRRLPARSGKPAPAGRAARAPREAEAQSQKAARTVQPAQSDLPPLSRAAELADRGELAAAAAICEERLRAAADDAEALHLLGVVRQAQGDAAAAERCFIRALYCDPNHAAAMVHLALLLEQRGDAAGAGRLKSRAARRKASA